MLFGKRSATAVENTDETEHKDYRAEWEAVDKDAHEEAEKLVPGTVYYLPKLGVAEEYVYTQSLMVAAPYFLRDSTSPAVFDYRPHQFRGRDRNEYVSRKTSDLDGAEVLFPAEPPPNTWTPNPVAIDPR